MVLTVTLWDVIDLAIYRWERECERCEAPISVVWADTPSSLVEMDLVGARLAAQPYASVEQRYSPIYASEVWGNVCPECSALQTNAHVRFELLQRLRRDDPHTTLTITPQCETCSEDAQRVVRQRPACDSCSSWLTRN